MPTTAKHTIRVEQLAALPNGDSHQAVDAKAKSEAGMPEQEKIAAMFKAGEAQWEQQKAQMAR